MDAKLERIRELINQKETVDRELEELLGVAERRLGRPRKPRGDNGTGDTRSLEEDVAEDQRGG